MPKRFIFVTIDGCYLECLNRSYSFQKKNFVNNLIYWLFVIGILDNEII